MLFSLEARFKTVAEAIAKLALPLERVRATGKVLGPLAELRRLKGGSLYSVVGILPDVPDYEAIVDGERGSVLVSRDASLIPSGPYDSIAAFLGDWGAVIFECGTAQYSSRIRIDFTAPRDLQHADQHIPFDRLLGNDARRRILERIVTACLKRSAPASLVQELMLASSAKHGFRPFRDATGLLECEILIRDDSAGINQSVALRTPTSDIVGAYRSAVVAIDEASDCRMALYGNRDRMRRLLDAWGEQSVAVSFGNTIARSEDLSSLEVRDHDRWWAEVQKSTVSEAALQELLRREEDTECYERIGIKWIGLGNLVGMASSTDATGWLEVVRSRREPARVYVFVADEFGSRSTKGSLESWIGGSLKAVHF